MPALDSLHIGHGSLSLPADVDANWNAQEWKLWLDGHAIDLDQFGTNDIPLNDFEPFGGEDTILREWNIALLDPTAGRHTLRYRTDIKHSNAVYDITWTFTIADN